MNRLLSHFFRLVLPFSLLYSCQQQSEKKSAPQTNRVETNTVREGLNPYVTTDQSPMDMCYYPKDFPILHMNGTSDEALVARVIYSRPQRKGRKIFGEGDKDLVQYGKEWRMGANEATEIEFFRDVIIANHKLAKGRYVMYCIPSLHSWKIAFNSNLFTWGLHMDVKKDIFRVDEPVMVQSPAVEDLTMFFEDGSEGPDLNIVWDTVRVKIPINIGL